MSIMIIIQTFPSVYSCRASIITFIQNMNKILLKPYFLLRLSNITYVQNMNNIRIVIISLSHNTKSYTSHYFTDFIRSLYKSLSTTFQPDMYYTARANINWWFPRWLELPATGHSRGETLSYGSQFMKDKKHLLNNLFEVRVGGVHF